MAEMKKCSQCGEEIPADAPEGLCPNCLLKVDLRVDESQPQPEPSESESEQRQTAPYSGRFVPPQPAELASHFPQLEILELLGQGGMGAVYKARQPGLDRLVALKILPREIGADPAFAERFTREARALAKLSHPNIVAVHDIGRTADGLFYFLMEFVDGVNLRQAIRADSMTPKEALAIVPQICDALQFAHDEGIVHRDIKPENVLLDKRGRVKIADFGLAKLLGHASGDLSLTGTQQVMGTLRYMAPEQMEGTKAVDHRADIYSLGVVFYELLTGEVPVGRFAPPSKKVQIDVRLDEVVLRALEEKPEQRYQHASDVKTEVEAIRRTDQPAPTLAALANTERTPAASEEPLEVSRLARHRLKWPAIGLLLAGISDAFLGLWIFAHNFDRVRDRVESGLSYRSPLFDLALSACILWCAYRIIAGAVKLMGLEAGGEGKYPVVLAMIVPPGLVLGLPFGIWALAVLSESEVKAAFSRRREQARQGTSGQPHVAPVPLVAAAQESPGRNPQAAPAVQSRLSLCALFGVIWLGLGLAASGVLLANVYLRFQENVYFAGPFIALCVFVPVLTVLGSVLLGGIAIAQIKRSGGKLYGLPLAVADLLVCPLLALGAVGVFFTMSKSPSPPPRHAASVTSEAAPPVRVLMLTNAKQLPSKTASKSPASEILRMMSVTYGGISSLTASGNVVTEIVPTDGSATTTLKKTFTINLARPEFYRITWTDESMPQGHRQGAAWNAGDGHKTLVAGKVGTLLTREMALAAATGVSGGVASTMPHLFFKDDRNNPVTSLSKPTLLSDEMVGSETCYVVAADQGTGNVKLWITKKDFLLKKMLSKLPPASSAAMEKPTAVEEFSDETARKTLKSLGQDSSPEAVEKMKKTIAKSRRRMGSFSSTTTTTFEAIRVNEVMIKEDFEYSVPKEKQP